MLFQLQSADKGTMTHSGVLEFTAEEGSCYIPFWMMQNLLLEEGGIITVTNISLPKATFVKLQPQHVDFLEISNHRAVLEHALRNFSCLTKGDVICVPYNSKNYFLEIKEVKPQDAVCIIETDCQVDFDAPVGYKDPSTLETPMDIPTKQSAYERSSACPSPALSSISAKSLQDNNDEAPKGLRIVDGKIIRPTEKPQERVSLADRTGATGVQPNAAIPVKAPEVDYWAINAGGGARLDGKAPAVLKDKDGTEVDVRKLRAEAAARRAASLEAASSWKDLNKPEEAPTSETTPVSKRKSKTGSKYSKLKGSAKAFQGSAKSIEDSK
jgi:ubiquitin fusion degradation protein 1